MQNNIKNYGLRTLYKGTFMEYTDTDTYSAFIYVPDIILSGATTDVMNDSIINFNIDNANELSIESSVKSTNSIICKPLFINKVIPILEQGDSVFVTIFDEDPKKIFYLDVMTEIPVAEEQKLVLRVGDSLIYIDRDEIILRHENQTSDDNSITINETGIELTGQNIVINGTNIGNIIPNAANIKEEEE